MPQISQTEFQAVPLRVHSFLKGVPLHDVWAVDLPRLRETITFADFLRTMAQGRSDRASRQRRARSFACGSSSVVSFAWKTRRKTLVRPHSPHG